jgi:hypothetical protein
MIITELYNGQGIGNQIWCYLVTRIISEKLGFEYGIMSPHKFKGQEFLEIDLGNPVVGGDGPEGGPPNSLPQEITHYYKEKVSSHPATRVNISKSDPLMYEILDGTKLEGCMQSMEYIKGSEDNIRDWIKTKDGMEIEEFSSDNICVIHIRGGDFRGSTSILGADYYQRAIDNIKSENPEIEFVIVTDDINYSRSILPGYRIVGGSSLSQSDNMKAGHHIGGPIWMDWSIIKKARYLIISSSSFSFWPSFLNTEKKKIIAPMYWGDHKGSNGYWSCWETIVDGWFYLDRNGEIFSSSECKKKRDKYEVRMGIF